MNKCIPFPGTAWASSAALAEEQSKRTLAALEAEEVDHLLSEPYWRTVCETYEAAIGHQLQAWQLLQLAELTKGFDSLVILLAIQATREARRPSFFYLRAILQRCSSEGITTFDRYAADTAKHRAQQNRKYR